MSATTRHAARRLAASLSRRLSLARAATSSNAVVDHAVPIEAPRRRNIPTRRSVQTPPVRDPAVNLLNQHRAWTGLTVGELRAQLTQRHGGWSGDDDEDEEEWGDHPLDAVMERLARETMGEDVKAVRIGDGGGGIQAASVKLKRKRKMAKHKHRKRRKRDRNKS
jgi:hypothetical protein